jgi:hypothetical protein
MPLCHELLAVTDKLSSKSLRVNVTGFVSLKRLIEVMEIAIIVALKGPACRRDCQSCGRVCLGAEIDPLFVDVAVRRWQAFTGEKARRGSDGAGFDALVPEARTTEQAS